MLQRLWTAEHPCVETIPVIFSVTIIYDLRREDKRVPPRPFPGGGTKIACIFGGVGCGVGSALLADMQGSSRTGEDGAENTAGRYPEDN
jgi:hypothetical protein